jgi:hypothetical protein
MDSGSKAIPAYGHVAKIEDKDDTMALDENRETYGAGVSYFFSAGETCSFLISMGYTKADFDTLIREYELESETDERRSDHTVTVGMDFFSRYSPHMGFFASYSYNKVSSNVAEYGYQQHILEAGFSIFY